MTEFDRRPIAGAVPLAASGAGRRAHRAHSSQRYLHCPSPPKRAGVGTLARVLVFHDGRQLRPAVAFSCQRTRRCAPCRSDPFTRFQKGLERVVGRGLGILAGLVLTTWFHDTALLTLVLIAALLTTFFYLYFAGRLAYTFLQAGLYVVAMFQIGHANPTSAVSAAEGLFAAIVLGVMVADVVTWLFGAERDLGIRLGEAPLWPPHSDWLSGSFHN